MYYTFGHVTASELGAGHCYLTVSTVSQEDGAGYRADVEFGVGTPVNGYLCGIVQQKHGTVLQIFYLEVNSVYITRSFDQLFIFSIFKHEISLI